MDFIDVLVTRRAEADSDFLNSVRDAGDEYRLAIDEFGRAEAAYLTDPLSDDREADAKEARDVLDKTRQAFDNQVKGAKAARTRKLNEARAEKG